MGLLQHIAAGIAGGAESMVNDLTAQVNQARQIALEEIRLKMQSDQRRSDFTWEQEQKEAAKEKERSAVDQLARDTANQRVGEELTQAQSAIDSATGGKKGYTPEKAAELKDKLGEGYSGLINQPTTMDRMKAAAIRSGDTTQLFNAEEKLRDNESHRIEKEKDLALREKELNARLGQLKQAAEAKSLQTMGDGRIAIVSKDGKITGYMKDPDTGEDIKGATKIDEAKKIAAQSYFSQSMEYLKSAEKARTEGNTAAADEATKSAKLAHSTGLQMLSGEKSAATPTVIRGADGKLVLSGGAKDAAPKPAAAPAAKDDPPPVAEKKEPAHPVGYISTGGSGDSAMISVKYSDGSVVPMRYRDYVAKGWHERLKKIEQ